MLRNFINLKSYILKGVFLALVLIISMPITSFAAKQTKVNSTPNPINLMDYQLAPQTIKIFTTPESTPPFQIGIANLVEHKTPEEYTYYQGVWIINPNSNKIGYPLLIQKFVVYKDTAEAVIVNKNGQMPYAQNLVTVQTASTKPQPLPKKGINSILKNPKEVLIHTPAGDFNTVLVKTYNPKTKEGLIQYLAKGLGTIRLEGYNQNKHYIIAQLNSYRPLNKEEAQLIKNSIPKDILLP